MIRASFVLLSMALLSCIASTPKAQASVPQEIAGLDLVSKKSVSIPLTTSGKNTVLVFLSAVCPCSASHEPVLKKLSEEFGSANFRFIGIHSNSDEDIWVAQEHFRKAGISFPVIQDAGAKLADAFGALKTPHVFVLGTKGDVLYQGGVDDSSDAARAKKPYLRDALASIQAGKAPSVRETRSLGCAIKRP
jgi:alkyl hydroperoxide reductase subunit AhpC